MQAAPDENNPLTVIFYAPQTGSKQLFDNFIAQLSPTEILKIGDYVTFAFDLIDYTWHFHPDFMKTDEYVAQEPSSDDIKSSSNWQNKPNFVISNLGSDGKTPTVYMYNQATPNNSKEHVGRDNSAPISSYGSTIRIPLNFFFTIQAK